MKLQGKGRLLRGMISAPYAFGANFNLQHTSYQRTVFRIFLLTKKQADATSKFADVIQQLQN